MWGIQVNVGRPGRSDWRWMRGQEMRRMEFVSEREATAQLELWYPSARTGCFRVVQIRGEE